MSKKLSKETFASEIDRMLEQAIVNGKLKPGERLIAESLADDFGVSRIPVRESLRALESAGWVEIRPHHGVYVKRWSRTELRHLFAVRTLIEGESARLAAAQSTSKLILDLNKNVKKYEKAIQDSSTLISELNREFHSLIVDATGNEVLREILERISRRVQWYFSTVTISRSTDSAKEHNELVEAIRKKNSKAAEHLMTSHVDRTEAAIESVLKQLDPDLIDP